ncbi:MAG: class I tRNA ligase family protein [Lachnospiraceae bacterium]|nr:class I tRNA ligase family protein [Lachnospiraceae bacterium]
MNITMLTPMNHREIEYNVKKFWDAEKIIEKNIADVFVGWSNGTEKNAAINLMNWLEDTQKEVFQEDLLLDYGADCLRLYLMFEKTPEPNDTWLDTWEECNLEGCYKFLGRFRRMILVADYANGLGLFQSLDVIRMKKKACVLQRSVMQHLAKGNTMPNRHNAIAVIMEGMNELQKEMRIGELVTSMHSHEIAMAVPHAQKQMETERGTQEPPRNIELDELLKNLLLLLAPFAPVLTEQLWQQLFNNDSSIFRSGWKEQYAEADMMKLPVQVNAKTKKVLDVSVKATREEIEEKAKQEISLLLQEKEYNVIYVPKKIINFVII